MKFNSYMFAHTKKTQWALIYLEQNLSNGFYCFPQKRGEHKTDHNRSYEAPNAPAWQAFAPSNCQGHHFLDTYAIGRSCKFGTHLGKGTDPKTFWVPVAKFGSTLNHTSVTK